MPGAYNVLEIEKPGTDSPFRARTVADSQTIVKREKGVSPWFFDFFDNKKQLRWHLASGMH